MMNTPLYHVRRLILTKLLWTLPLQEEADRMQCTYTYILIHSKLSHLVSKYFWIGEAHWNYSDITDVCSPSSKDKVTPLTTPIVILTTKT